jgi:subtilase family serine protease
MKTALLGATMLAAAPAYAALPTLPAATPLITGTIDDSALVSLHADHPAALAHAQDRGALDDSRVLPHVMLALQRPPALQAAFDRLVHEQYKPGSAQFHQWISASDLRAFGPAQADIDRVTAWLQSRGLSVNSVSPSGMAIDFAGRVADIGSAFHTSLHNVTLKGEAHIANISDASIPAALAPVVHGVTLANFFPKPNLVKPSPQFTIPATIYPAFQAVAPGDFFTVYNLTPLLNGSSQYGKVTGAGATVAVVEQTNIKAKDWTRFRTYFGLSGFAGTLSLIHPGSCGDPGYTGDEGEAALDAEWSSATAPDANIIEASCPGSDTSFGVMTTLQNLVELNSTPATIYSISYGGCETGDGLSFLQMWTNLLQEGASQGISISISSGDSGSSCDRDVIDSNGLSPNGLASSEYSISIGGTDFQDAALNEVKQYWTKKNAGPEKISAKSYIPEIPWDNSCANSIIASVVGKESPMTFCNDPASANDVQNGVGGTGGASQYYAKPDWQLTNIPGVPADGARDQPDVSFFAANGIWNHFLLFCMSDQKEGGAPCQYTGTYSNGVPKAIYQAAGGTSFDAPAFAGILALISSGNYNRRLGNPAPRLYQLAQLQYSNSLLLNNCNASLGNKVSSACIFYNVTTGDNAEPCYQGTLDCYTNSQSTMGIGILSADTQGTPAYLANTGYSLATGLGSLNVTNLLYNY